MKKIDWESMAQEAKRLHPFQMLTVGGDERYSGVKKLFADLLHFYHENGWENCPTGISLLTLYEVGVRQGQRMERARRHKAD